MTEFGGGTHIVPDTGGGPASSVGPLLPGVQARVIDCASGLDARALAGVAPPGSAEARVQAWVRRELRDGRGAEPALVAGLLVRLAAGHADQLSGCHLSVHDDLDAILAAGPAARDRHQLRLRGREDIPARISCLLLSN